MNSTIFSLLRLQETKPYRAVLLIIRKGGSQGVKYSSCRCQPLLEMCLLTSLFIVYAGYFDQHLRKTLYASWTQHMKQANVSFGSNLVRLEVCIIPHQVILFITV